MPHPLFSVFGVELEYMIVDATSLDVRPITDQVLFQIAGEYLSEVELGEIAWSNELALHVIELKTNGPAASLDGLAPVFQQHVNRIQDLLAPWNARLLPTAMHPWMDADRDLKLWPHEYNAVYQAYNQIFDCRGHGWANLQSVHLNLPFADDHQFGRLHAAIRLLMPILPALAASSPVMDRKVTGLADSRLEVYRHNADRVPLVAGQVIPERVFDRKSYEQQIFQPMYDQIAPLDPDRTLCHEWLNSRGAIARFDRHAIEIRVLDIQECPTADLAICRAIVAILQSLTQERWTTVQEQQSLAVAPLADILHDTIRAAERTRITDATYLRQFGFLTEVATAGQLWRYLIDQTGSEVDQPTLGTILTEGTLATRILRALDGDMSRLEPVYRRLADCLAEGEMFHA